MRPALRQAVLDRAIDPFSLFGKYNAAGLYIPTFGNFSRLFQDDEGTTPVTAAADPIGNITESGPTGTTAVQATDNSRMILQNVGGVWVARGDGSADNMLTNLNPATSMTMIAAVEFNAVSDIVIGANDASFNNRCILQTHTDGKLGAGVGGHSSSNINAGADIRDIPGVAALRFNGTTVSLFWKPFTGSISKIYEAAQSGTPTTTVPIRLGATNNNGTASNLLDGDIYSVFAIQAALTDAEIRSIAERFSRP